MVADIRAEFKEILRKVDWMDDKTRQSALEKADAMATHIAYPDELLDDSKLGEFYHDVSCLIFSMRMHNFNIFIIILVRPQL